MNISFQGYMENEATFLAEGVLTAGHPVTVYVEERDPSGKARVHY